ncbi:MAG: alanine racemase, partial [Pseudomonadota bacterium]
DIAHLMLQCQDGDHGLTVSTLAEADYFFHAGFNQLLYAVGMAPGKLDAVAARVQHGMKLIIILDSAAVAQQVVDAGQRHGVELNALIEIDADGKRGGLAPQHPELMAVAHTLQQAGAQCLGVMTHMGGAYHCRDRAALKHAALAECEAVRTAANRLRTAGLQCAIVSVGSTPTACVVEDLSGVSEVRAGTYVFYDLVMHALGVCRLDQIALSVLAEVIGHRPEAGELIIDAGWMALSRDRGTASHAIDQGYGLVCELDGRPIKDLVVLNADQEHGLVGHRTGQTVNLDAYPIGTRLRILPNHACATAAQHAGYWCINTGHQVIDYWPRLSGWT